MNSQKYIRIPHPTAIARSGDGALTCRVECTHAKARQRDLDFTTAAIILKSAHLFLYSLCRLGGLSLHARRRRSSIMYTPLDRDRTQQAPARANVRGCHELLRPCMQRILPTIHGINSLCHYYHHMTPPRDRWRVLISHFYTVELEPCSPSTV